MKIGSDCMQHLLGKYIVTIYKKNILSLWLI